MVNASELHSGGYLLRFPPFWARNTTEDSDGGDHAEGPNCGGGSSSTATAELRQEPQHLLEEPLRPPNIPMSERRMRSVLDGLMSPFMSCVQQPISSCVSDSPSLPWEYDNASSREGPGMYLARDNSVLSPVLLPPCSSGTERYYTRDPSPNQCSGGLVKPRSNDVVCGRGGSNVRHPGNENFRCLIAANKAIYDGLTKKQKMMMARQIVEMVHNSNPPGRFLARDLQTGLWEDIGWPRSVEKASQAFRDSNGDPTSEPLDVDPKSSAPCQIPKSSRTTPPPPPIRIPPHLRSVFRMPNSMVNSELLPSPSHYLQTPVLIESASSISTARSQNPATYRYLAYRSSPVSSTTSSTPRGSYGLSPSSTPGNNSMYSTPKSATTTRSPILPTFTEEAESPIELTYSCSSISIPSDIGDPSDWKKKPRLADYDDDVTTTTVTMATTTAPPPSSHSSTNSASSSSSLLPLSDRIVGRPLFSPSGLLQSRHYRPRRQRSLPAPSCSSSTNNSPSSYHQQHQQSFTHPLDDSDIMDGLTALSTAAFLRLDETD